MADESYTLSFTGANTDTLLGNESDTADYVVSQGTSGDWNYRKWNSGACELWGLHSITPTESTESGNGYYSEILSINLPFKVANMVLSGTVDNLYNLVNPGGSWDSQVISFRLWRATAITEVAVTARLVIYGRWSS